MFVLRTSFCELVIAVVLAFEITYSIYPLAVVEAKAPSRVRDTDDNVVVACTNTLSVERIPVRAHSSIFALVAAIELEAVQVGVLAVMIPFIVEPVQVENPLSQPEPIVRVAAEIVETSVTPPTNLVECVLYPRTIPTMRTITAPIVIFVFIVCCYVLPLIPPCIRKYRIEKGKNG
jgi:hypothetical protein